MSKAIRMSNNNYLDSSSVIYQRQSLKFKLDLFKTIQIYNHKTGEPGWGRIAYIPGSGGYQQRNVTLLLTSGIGSENGYGIIVFTWYNNERLCTKILCGNIDTNSIFARKNSDNSYEIWFHLKDYYRPLQVQLLAVYNTGQEPWNVFENCGWIQYEEPTGTKNYFTYV